jgi:hypothetical protein
MTAEQMLYEFELSADKVSSKNAMNLPVPAKVAYLNRGQRSLILTYYSGNNNSREAVDETRRRKDQLGVLIVPGEQIAPEAKIPKQHYTVDLAKTKQAYLYLLGQYGIGSKGACKQQVISIDDTRINDLREALTDSFRRPDFRWRKALMITAANQLHIYTSDYVLDHVVLDYLRHPRAIDVVGYTGFDGKASTDVDCELPLSLHDEVVNYAVMNLKADLGDPAFQTALFKQQQAE